MSSPRVFAQAQVVRGIDSATLDVVDGNVTIDESWSPYIQASIQVPLEGLDWGLTDPREAGTDCSLYLHRGFSSTEGFFLTLRGREVDYERGIATLTAASDEALLQDWKSTSDAHDDNRVYEASLRSLIDNAILTVLPGSPILTTLDGADGDADLTVYTYSENLVVNPSAEVNTTGWTAQNATLTRVSAVSAPAGSYVFRISSPSSASSAINSDPIAVVPGTKYVLSGSGRAGTVGSGSTISDARTLKLYTVDELQLAVTPHVANTTSWDRVSVEVTIPTGVTEVFIRAIFGHAAGVWDWDAIRLSEYTHSPVDATYFDGDSPDALDGAPYVYSWSGTAHASISIRQNTSGFDRSVETFVWYPGVSAWDYVAPLVQAAGLRLFCDTERRWRLVDPDWLTTPGEVELGTGTNVVNLGDEVSRDIDEWGDAAVVEYRWTDRYGNPKTRYDFSDGSGTKPVVVRIDAPYPGPGAANAIVRRAQRMGRLVTPEALLQIDAEPGQVASIEFADSSTVEGQVSAVTMSLAAGRMSVTIREEIPEP